MKKNVRTAKKVVKPVPEKDSKSLKNEPEKGVDTPSVEETPDMPELNIVGIEPQYQRLLTSKGFIDAFWEMLSYYCSHELAYDAVERQYEAQFGKKKYSSFDSFRICRDKFISKRNEVKNTDK
jgi:hypothetical protein